ncbi:hypothetical protein D3C86_2046390 [compost metagenome]
MTDLFTRDGTTSGELAASTYILLGLAYVVLTLVDFSLELLDLIVLGACLTNCASQVRRGALVLDFGIHGVQCHQWRVGIDMIGVVGADCRHSTADL